MSEVEKTDGEKIYDIACVAAKRPGIWDRVEPKAKQCWEDIAEAWRGPVLKELADTKDSLAEATIEITRLRRKLENAEKIIDDLRDEILELPFEL